MKLSAPPPPPPEPPEPPEPNPPGEPQAEGAAATGDATPAAEATTPEPTPSSMPQPHPATWPTWFPQFDVALAVLALGFGFMIASFAARNADIWLHLATGKRLVAGQYAFGTDPFSYTAADRVWVNHNWLWDLGAYLFYGGTGATLVVLKAFAVALAGALLIGIRRPGFPLWPWAALTALAFLASAQRLLLQPIVGSVLLLAATLFVLFRVPHRPGSWRTPLLIGGIFWFWANIDAWFILGPIAVALVLLGEYLQKSVLPPSDGENAENEAFGRLPDVRTLLLALAVGVLACMMNPHHFRVWELPFELAGSDVIKPDPGMNNTFNLAPTDDIYRRLDELGWNPNGLAYALFFFVGAVILVFVGGRARAAQLALWIGFALLSLITVYAIPFFVVVAVPLLAMRLNAFSSGVTLGNKSDRRTRLVLLGSGGGRVLCAIALLVSCVRAYPGWMQPADLGTNLPRNVEWAVVPDPGLVKAATQIQSWRESGALPPDARGLILSATLSDYCAWYAPDEKVYLNSRFNHHRPELPDYIAARGALMVYFTPGEPPNQNTAGAVLKKHGASYLALYDSRRQIGQAGLTFNLHTLRRFGMPISDPTIWDVLGWTDWTMWYQDGRTLVFGWQPGLPPKSETNSNLHVDPVALAFGPNVERLPAGSVVPPPGPRSWMDDFSKPVRAGSPHADDALGWLDYKRELGRGLAIRSQVGNILFDNAALDPGQFTWHQLAFRGSARARLITFTPSDGVHESIPVISVRAARRAIAANPDHPDGYFALALALGDPDLPVSDGERAVWQVTALRQCLDRLPPPEQYRPGVYATSPTLAAFFLTQLYCKPTFDEQRRRKYSGMSLNVRPLPDPLRIMLGTVASDRGQAVALPFIPLDLAHQTQQLALDYSRREFAGLPEPIYRDLVGFQEAEFKALDRDVRAQLDTYSQATRDRPPGVAPRLNIALQLGLVGEAIRLLRKTPDLDKEFGDAAPDMAVRRIGLELVTGRLEESVADLAVIREDLEKADPGDIKVRGMRAGLRLLEYHQAVLMGDYHTAGTLLEDLMAKSIAARANYPPRKKDKAMGGPLPIPRLALAPESPVEMGLWLLPSLFQNSLIEYYGTKTLIVNQVREDGDFFFLRGLLSLFAGDMADARFRFEQSNRPLPPGWDFPAELPHPVARQYLRLMDAADKRSAGKK